MVNNLYHERNPWAQKFFSARARCNQPNHSCYNIYGGRGIKCFLTLKEVESLWSRDKAYEMDRPSLDRIDSDGNYEFSNCRFLEYRENALAGSRRAAITCVKAVDQYSLDKKLISSFKSIGDAARQLGDYDYKYSIAACCRKEIRHNKRKLTSHGYIWRFKGESPEW